MKTAFRGGAAMAVALTTAAAARGSPPPEVGHAYVIAVGYNGVPPGAGASVQPLRFADDDAIAFYSFAAPIAQRARLLTAVDVDTERRLGAALPPARPPTLGELRAAIADVREALDEDARRRLPSTVYFYYSGHGSAADGQEPSLALADAALTRSMLYEGVLAALPATHVHLFVDACHAAAVVRPRDAEASMQATTDEERARYALTTTLARFPNAGAVVASTRSAQAHEWDAYLGGVFTHELLSALRGAADVNGDDRVEYSEIAAFLAAANSAVRDPRARLEAVTRAPTADPRVAVVDLRDRAAGAVLALRGGAPGAVYVEDDRGDRLVDAHAEEGRTMRLRLPADRSWYVHASQGEAEVKPARGEWVAFESLPLRAAPVRRRGALESALYEGLFATPFGPAYYRGFIDRATDLVPVTLEEREPADAPLDRSAATRPPRPGRTAGWILAGTAGALTLGAGVLGGMALQARSDFDGTSVERRAADAAERYSRDTAVAAALGGAALAAAGVSLYLLLRPDLDPQAIVRAASGAWRVDF